MGGDDFGTEAGNKNRHQREAGDFKKGAQTDRNTDMELLLDETPVGAGEAFGMHAPVKGRLHPDRQIDEEGNEIQNGEGDAGTRASHRGKTEPAVHEDGIQRSLQGQNAQRNPHRDAGTRECGIDGNEGPPEEARGKTEGREAEVFGRHAGDVAPDFAHADPQVAPQQKRYAEER